MLKLLLQVLRWIRRYGIRLLILSLFIVFLLPRSTVQIADRWRAIAYEVSAHQFDYIGWEIGAIGAKADQVLFGQHPFMTEADRSAFVRQYMQDLTRARSLEAEINAVYADPAVADPDAATAAQQAERDALRDDLRKRQSTAEAILEGQVAAVLVDEGFGTLGQLLPPMSMRFTRVPNLLVTSPRDEIRLEVSINLNPLTVDEQAAIEERLDERYDVSSLIVPLGGIALYPAMILETTSIPYAAEVFAHEWLHHYLFFYPLGIYYLTSADGFGGEARIINETVAGLFGQEVGRLVVERYYPELVPPEPPDTDQADEPDDEVPPPDPDAFDFAAEMHETRVRVDELLAAGEVEAAEAYMEERRRLFVANGYGIRKLNQAFFAFYGGYQASGVPGVGGEDPIGPAVRAIREQSDTLLRFVEVLRGVTDREQLLALRGRLMGESAP